MDTEESHDVEEAKTEVTMKEPIAAKIKLQIPTAIRFAVILAASLSVVSFVGIDQNVIAHQLNHDVRHALGFACH